MNVAIQTVGFGLIVPAAVSIFVTLVCRRWLSSSISQRCGLAIALATGFIAGYALLTPPDEWIPTRHWHWLPILAGAASILSAVGLARGVSLVERWSLILILAIAAACLLVPDWEALQPTRHWYVLSLVIYLFVLCIGIPPLVDRCAANLLRGLFPTVAMVLSVMILATVSIRFGQLAGLLAAATTGTCIRSRWYGNQAMRGLTPVFCILAGGLAFIGCIEPQEPLFGLLVLPASPLAIWVSSLLPLPKDGLAQPVIQGLVVLLLIGIGVGWVLIAS